MKGYKWLLYQNQRERNAFLVTGSTSRWLSITNLFLKIIKVKGRHCPDYQICLH